MTAAKSKPVNPHPCEGGASLGVLGVGAGDECHSPCARQLFGPETDSQETLVLGEEGDQPCVPTGPKTPHDTNTKDDNQVGDKPKTEEKTKVPTRDTQGDTPPQTAHDTNTKDDNQVGDTPKIEETTKVPIRDTQGDAPPQTPPSKKPLEMKSPQANGDEIAPGKAEKKGPARASSKTRAKSKAKAASSKVKAAPRTTKKKHSKTKEKTEEQKVVHRAASKRWHDKWIRKGILKTAKKLSKARNKPSKRTCNKREASETGNDKAVDKRPAPPAPVTKHAKTSSSGSDKGEACEFLMCLVFRKPGYCPVDVFRTCSSQWPKYLIAFGKPAGHREEERKTKTKP